MADFDGGFKIAARSSGVLTIIGREQMRDSPVIQQFIEEGEALGMRKALRDVLEIRFGPDALGEFKEALDRIENLEVLGALLKSALQARRIGQFRKALEGA